MSKIKYCIGKHSENRQQSISLPLNDFHQIVGKRSIVNMHQPDENTLEITLDNKRLLRFQRTGEEMLVQLTTVSGNKKTMGTPSFMTLLAKRARDLKT